MAVKCPKCSTDNPVGAKSCQECASPLPSRNVSLTKTLGIPEEELARGTVFANRYQIIEKLGKGGMGRVYRVYDTLIERDIALKLIKPEIVADKKSIGRFRSELVLAREISHGNVCRLYDLGEEEGVHFITMEYVTGEDLKSFIKRAKRLDEGKALSLAKQICEGLSEIHRLGIVHRDLKPSNIMIDKEGQAKIMDFGIARSLWEEGATDTGDLVGTPQYMSPEQVEGKKLDQGSDIYSLGIILYEMVTGQVPFEGDTALAIAMRHKDEKPKEPKEFNPLLSDALNSLILKCLEKDRDIRFRNATELLDEFERIEKRTLSEAEKAPKKTPPAAVKPPVTFRMRKLLVPALISVGIMVVSIVLWNQFDRRERAPLSMEKPSIAVLPFADISRQEDQEYFCDGITEEIIARLSRIEGWRLISRTSVLKYKNTDKDIRMIGRELNVETVLEGSVRKEEENIRITAQLINAEDGFHLWSDTYNRKMDRIFDIQSDIAEKIARSLKVTLSSQEEEILRRGPTEDPEAYNLYLKGRFFWSKRTEEGLKKAIEFFQQAVVLDSSFALAYAGIADAYNNLGSYEFISPQDAHPMAKKAALKALEIDEGLAEAYASLGFVNMRYDWDWPNAEKNFKKAIALNPGYAMTRGWYGAFLRSMGRFDEAFDELNKAKDLDPLSLPILTTLGSAFYFARKYDQAIQQCQRVLEIDASFHWAHNVLGIAYLQKSLLKDAISEFQKAIDLSGGISWYRANLAHGYAVSGDPEKALKILKELQANAAQADIPWYEMAIVWLAMGEIDQVFQILEELYEKRSGSMMHIKVDPRFDGVRTDPRFLSFLRKMNLED